jgi:hypothetical protein
MAESMLFCFLLLKHPLLNVLKAEVEATVPDRFVF